MGSNSAEAFTVAGSAPAESVSLRPASRKSSSLFAKVYDVKNSAVLTGLAALLQALTDGPHLERATICKRHAPFRKLDDGWYAHLVNLLERGIRQGIFREDLNLQSCISREIWDRQRFNNRRQVSSYTNAPLGGSTLTSALFDHLLREGVHTSPFGMLFHP
jgi:hypothetical protein